MRCEESRTRLASPFCPPPLRDAFCTVRVTAPGFGTQRFRWNEGDATAAERMLKLRPVGRITGRLTTTDPQALRGIKLVFSTTATPAFTAGIAKPANGKNCTVWESEGTAVVAADEAGRFVVPAIAEGDLKVFFLDIPAKSSLLPSPPSLLSVQAGETLSVDLPMLRTTVVHGTILTQDTRQPVAGAELSIGPHSVVSDAQGRYESACRAGAGLDSGDLPARQHGRQLRTNGRIRGKGTRDS